VVGKICGYPEIGTPSTPPKYYKTLNYSGSPGQTGSIAPVHVAGTNGSTPVTFDGVNIPAHADYVFDTTGVFTYTNAFSGADTTAPPDIGEYIGGAIPTPCAESEGNVNAWTGVLIKTTAWSWTLPAGQTDPLTGLNTLSGSFDTNVPLAQTAVVAGPGSGTLMFTNFQPTGHGNLIDGTATPITIPATGNGGFPFPGPGGSWGTMSSTEQTCSLSGTGWSGSITQTLTDEQVESTVIAAATPDVQTFDGGTMGGDGGWSGVGSTTYDANQGPNPGDGVDYIGPRWADRTGRMVDYANVVSYGIHISNLVPGMPMKCTVRIYRASYSIDDSGTATFGSPSQVGSDVVYTFTPGATTHTIGPGETLLGSTVTQGWIYGAKILAVEPQ
jgi:hypothetical protein